VIDLHAAFGQEFFDVAVGQPVAQLPAHRDRDHLGWETEPGEGRPRYRCADTTTAHQTTLPDLRSVNATMPAHLFFGHPVVLGPGHDHALQAFAITFGDRWPAAETY
jgi:hypothetical protein